MINEIKMYAMTCYLRHCGIQFAVPDEWDNDRRKDGQGFYCPNGHRQCYTDDENSRLKKQIESLKSTVNRTQEQRDAARANAERIEHRRRAEKGHKTRILNRIAKGVCPHCNRSFEDLARHMASKHTQEDAQ